MEHRCVLVKRIYKYLWIRIVAKRMVIEFLERMDISIVLLLQDFLNNKDASACSMICTRMQKRCRELKNDLTTGRSERRMVMDAGRYWKFIDIDFQLKNRHSWNSFAREAFLAEMKRNSKKSVEL